MSWGKVDNCRHQRGSRKWRRFRVKVEKPECEPLQCASTIVILPLKDCDNVRPQVFEKMWFWKTRFSEKKYLLWAYRAPWVCAPVRARRAWLSIALLSIWWLVMDLAAQIIETLAVWTLAHYQPRLYTTSTWLGALKTVGRNVVFTHACEEKVLVRVKKRSVYSMHLKLNVLNEALQIRAFRISSQHNL